MHFVRVCTRHRWRTAPPRRATGVDVDGDALAALPIVGALTARFFPDSEGWLRKRLSANGKVARYPHCGCDCATATGGWAADGCSRIRAIRANAHQNSIASQSSDH